MKFKHLFLTVSVMALFSSCSNDELVSENTSHGDAIAFSVTTTNATRAADYWCNSNLPHFFEVSATYKDPTATKATTYFNGEMYSQNTEGKYIQNDGNYRFWPAISADNPLNVWAYKVKAETKNGDTYTSGSEFATFTWNDGAPTITMTPEKEAAKQHDLLYAYTQVKTKPEFGKTAAINFRHALSQIVFYAKCENKKVYVEIEEIALVNAAKSGIFTLPTETNVTDENLKNHTQAGTAKTDGLGTWALTYDGTTTTTGEGEGQTSTFTQNKAYYAYTASCLKSDGKLTALTPGADAWTNLTDNKNPSTVESGTHSEYGQSLLVLPQTKYSDSNNNNVAKYVPYTEEGNTKTYKALSEVGGACIAIKCKIRNISGITSPVDENDIYLWGSKNKAEYLVVPVDFTWEQGKKYIYKINFSKLGHGGYDPDNGKEVLVPIELSVKVDDFAEATEIEKTADGDNI